MGSFVTQMSLKNQNFLFHELQYDQGTSRLLVHLRGLEYLGYNQYFITRHVNIISWFREQARIPVLRTQVLLPAERREKMKYCSISQVTHQQNKRGDEFILLLERLITERQKYDWKFVFFYTQRFCTAAVTTKASPSAKNFTVMSHPCWNLPSQTARIKQLNTDQWSASC